MTTMTRTARPTAHEATIQTASIGHSDAAGGQEASHHGSVSPVAATVDHDVSRHGP